MDADLFISLFIAHIIGDFYLQTDHFCRQKAALKLKCRFLYLHSLTVGLLSWLLIPTSSFWLCFLIITVSHLTIDIIKVHLPHGLGSFCLDQLAHMAVLTAIATLFHTDITLPVQWVDVSPTFSAPRLLLAILICMKPANIFIKLVLEKYQVGESETCNDIKNAGALIGDLERLLTILFVLLRQFDAIGFIVAAKSLLRFKETDTAKTEYVLAGTFLSFGIAIACGLLVRGLA